MDIFKLIADGGFYCASCGRKHEITLGALRLGDGALKYIPSELAALGVSRPFILCDLNTAAAAGDAVCAILDEAKVPHSRYTLSSGRPAPDERTLGEAVMRFDARCDGIIGVGGGVINDTCKLMTNLTHKPYIYTATAPSMDGYASSSSSMEALGLKTTIASIPADTIIADTAVIASAPRDMILAGIGDMAAKYVSIAEWRMAHIITGEYYCPEVAEMVEESLASVVRNAADALGDDIERRRSACGEITKGLILAGLAMTCAGVSRPASGMEHYISHIRDMRGLAHGSRTDFHGIQCGFAVLPCLETYKKLSEYTPDKTRALAHAAAFDYSSHAKEMRSFVGEGAEAMIALEAREGKYSPEKHAARLDVILAHWDELTAVMRTLPSPEEYRAFCSSIGFPTEASELEITPSELEGLIRFAPDVRDKYVLGRLVFDLGFEG